MPFRDSRLRLMFRCCHPTLDRKDQVALTLDTLGGLTIEEIAKGLLMPEARVAEHLDRARCDIEAADAACPIPSRQDFQARLPTVQTVICLIFNEGYLATMGNELCRPDLCAEAIRLGRGLCELLPRDAKSVGLLALMLLQDSRREARFRHGELVTLEDQDRSLWNRGEISEGLALVELAIGRGPVGPYQLQAAIAALHAEAERPQDTDWRQIVAIYGKLLEIDPSPVIALNQAVAIAMAEGLEQGLERIDNIVSAGELEGYDLFHPARAICCGG